MSYPIVSRGYRSSRSKTGFVRADFTVWMPQPVKIPPPGASAELGKLTLNKENGIVKGLEYQCVCGHKDYFVCE